MNDWFHNLFEQRETAQAALPASAAAPDTPAPEPDAHPRLATGTARVDTTVVPSEYQGSEIVRVMPGAGATPGAQGGFEIQQARPVQGPFVVGAPALGTPSIGSASGNAISISPREDRRDDQREQRPEPAGEPPPQPARGSPSVRFESSPDAAAPEPAR